MPDTDRRPPKLEDYQDAVALLRATLSRDDDGVQSILLNCEPGQLVQALVLSHLQTILNVTQSYEQADAYLANVLEQLPHLKQDEQ